MSVTIELPANDGARRRVELHAAALGDPRGAPFQKRIAFAAAHVTVDALAECEPAVAPVIDWETTLAYRRYLWSLGFAVAEAMDTAQRGGGLSWLNARELIQRASAEAKACGGRIACGVGTDHLSPGANIDAVIAAYEEQLAVTENAGSQAILMASRALAACARGPEDYARVYGRLLRQSSRPVILHWLGEMFDPQLAGYWGSSDINQAMATCLAIIAEHRGKIDGIKISLLDKNREIEMRRRLPNGVRMYTGDDFHYDELIAGDDHGYSHALLGIFDAIAPAAAAALRAFDSGHVTKFRDLLAPTVPLSRHIFRAPTYAYKTGVVFLAYLNGHQNHFRMLGGQEGARSLLHLCDLLALASGAGLLRDPELAARRMKPLLDLGGFA
jgi:hypothetical protein